MAQRKEELYMTEGAYFALEEASPEIRYEYNDGQVRMLAGQSGNHARVNDNISWALRSRLSVSCFQYPEMRFEPQVKRKKKYYYPDRVVCCDARDQTPRISLIHYPCLVFEILSESTESIDRLEKLAIYQAHETIQGIVFIDPDIYHIEVYQRAGMWQWEMTLYQQEGETISLACIEARIPIEEFYQGIVLLPENDGEEG
jgi:Uma2 family endonuclease